jgi:hypothetical protein
LLNNPDLKAIWILQFAKLGEIKFFTQKPNNEHTIFLRFLGIILGALRLEFSVYNVYITNQFHATFAQGGGGRGWEGLESVRTGDCG